MTELGSSAAAMPTGGLPYFTDADAAWSRSSGGRDPLGLLPVWSAFGRRLVPNLASPVGQVNGIKAVVPIQWLINPDDLQSLLERGGARRSLQALTNFQRKGCRDTLIHAVSATQAI
ncbi:hypothetical protein [Paraburkholderia sediminicola]|uniref:hypothetical protein n=1 Tax=Paraburkholderia sediminicola TaxID=458836 RepID=UPI0038BABFAA